MSITLEIKKFVKTECKKPTANYDVEIFDFHLKSTVKYALMLAEKERADKEVIELAAWLHDIGSVMRGRDNHHITGAEIAENKLKSLGYNSAKIEKIKECILSHRGSRKIKRISKEAKIVAEADAMSHFDVLPGLFKAYYVCEKKDGQGGARKEVRQKLINSYNKLSKGAKKIIKPRFDAAMLLLD